MLNIFDTCSVCVCVCVCVCAFSYMKCDVIEREILCVSVPDESGATRFLRDVEARRFHTSIEISHDSIAALVLTFQMMKICLTLFTILFVLNHVQSIVVFHFVCVCVKREREAADVFF